ncbi:cadmium-translocating P-type ATPase [Clostridium niameyense]|uniref:Cadmium-translocating P-type ATPase n=1 Tax=Clostridium niameyense TaxID=1622073 RepID=A0A6M0RB26_9CLOT|nr:heavy metal translocating P-type ATPase [Clostridium niameyense]NEZ47495.1 cadmium-translocating P-type ATPase [Clostridium niameyense]
MKIKKEILLNGLNCANCAAKIEDKVQKLKKVNNAFLNFNTSTLMVEMDSSDEEIVFKSVEKIVNRIEPGVEVLDKAKYKQKNKVKIPSGNQIHVHNHIHDNGCHCHEHEHCNSNNDNDSHNHKKINLMQNKEIIRIIIGIILLGCATFVKTNIELKIGLYITAYILIGVDVLLTSIKNISRGQVFDENFLMSVATIAAIFVGQYPEAVAVMLFYKIGEYFQEKAVNKSRKSITELMNIRPDYANLQKSDNIMEVVSPESVKVDDVIVVKPGEKIPLDGIIVEGNSSVDTSAITGESLVREVSKDSEVLSGYINKNKLIKIKVTKTFGESTVSKILDLTENAAARKAKTEKFITKFAKYYTPIVVFSAMALAIVPKFVVSNYNAKEWIYKAAVFLVVSCPCALVISIPLSFFAGIGSASRKGILIKTGSALESLYDLDCVVFDKTGTLTKGIFKVSEINPKGISKEELLKYAAYVEVYSNHPIGKSVLRYYKEDIDNKIITKYEEIVGKGVKAYINDVEVIAGNENLMSELGIKYDKVSKEGVVLYISLNKKYVGNIVISDEVKEDSKKAVMLLKKMGINKTVMLTGDRKSTGETIGKRLGIDEICAELLPQDKVEKMKQLKENTNSKKKVMFVGDGVNDAPVLAMSDIGVSMGGVGSDAAIEASDLVLMLDEPSKLIDALKISKKTHKIVWENIIFILAIKVIVLVLAAFGIGTMWMAVFADVGVALISIINALRIL